MRRSTIRTVLVSLALVAGLAAVPVAAQSPVPSAPPPTIAPTPTPDSGIDWPPMMFEGSDPGGLLVFTSDCGVWGQDPITLHGEGEAGTADLVVTFDTYEEESFQWFGHVTGSTTAPNGYTGPVDEGALIYYDMDGHWILVAGPAGQIPARGCAPMSPEPSGAAPG